MTRRKWLEPINRLYCVRAESDLWSTNDEPDEDDPDENVWTVSDDPNCPGWETDGGYDGYGLPKAIAEEIVRRWNWVSDQQQIESASYVGGNTANPRKWW